MKRNLAHLKTGHFDLIIVGAGIHGATLAMTAAKAGFQVALLEMDDFGHSTSANSLKIIHGGIRYLQHGDFKRMRESIVSRREMMRFAPHLVKPLPCMMPTYGHGIKGRETMRVAFGLYDLVAWDRNRGLAPENRLPMGESISRDEVRWVVPGIKDQGLTGGAVWYDAIASSTERLVLEYIEEAARYGAQVANYAKVKEIRSVQGRVTGVVVRDLRTTEEFTVSGRVVINAAGPWTEELGEHCPSLANQLWSVSANVVVKKRLFKKFAVGLEGKSEFQDKDALIRRGKLLFFFVPWQEEYTMIGTTNEPYEGVADEFHLTRSDLEKLIDEINGACPQAEVSMEDVTFFHGGLLPMKEADTSQADSVQVEKSSEIIDHGKNGGTIGCFSIKGVKYTTAPGIASKVLKKLTKERHLPPTEPGCYRIENRKKPDLSGCIAALGDRFLSLREELRLRYGGSWSDVFACFAASGCLKNGEPVLLSETPALYLAELLYFIHDEMAWKLTDVLFRRSGRAASECPDDTTLEMVSRAMGRQLGWTEEQREQEVAAVKDVFSIINE